MIVCAVAFLVTGRGMVARASEMSGVGGRPSAIERPAAEHELLWRAPLVRPDIYSIALNAVDLGAIGFGAGGSDVVDPACRGREVSTGLLVAVESRTAGPLVELRDAAGGELLWRRLPGGVVGGSLFAGLSELPECVVAAGSTLMFLEGDGPAIASARLPGLLRSAAVGGNRACACVGRPRSGFADSLVLFERRPGFGAVGSSLVPAWSRALDDRNESFDDGFSRPVFGDTDGDGRDELLVIERMNEVVCRAEEGNERWRVTLGEKSRFKPIGVVSAKPVVADVTGDGIPDVVVGCFAGAVVVLDGELGEEIARLQFGTEAHEEHMKGRRLSAFIRDALASTGEPIGEILSVDLDGSAGKELVFGCSDGYVYAVSPRTGARLWRLRPGRDVYDRPVADPRDAGRLVLWDEERVHVLDATTGVELATLSLPSIATAAVLCWSDDDVTVATADGLAGNLEVWRIAVPRAAPRAAEAPHTTTPE